MANPFFDLNPAMSGILAQPQTLTNPIQNPLSPQDQSTVQAMEDARLKNSAIQQALLKAAVLRDQPNYAKGSGPLGVRPGQGPFGWATSVADAIAGVIAKKRQDAGTQATTEAMGAGSAADNEYIRNFLQGAPGGLYDTGYGMSDAQRRRTGQDALSYVSQGSPLSLGNQ